MQKFASITRAHYTDPKEIRLARSQVYKLLLSVTHTQAARLKDVCGLNYYFDSNQPFTLEGKMGSDQYVEMPELHVVKTIDRSNYMTATTHALIYACWLGDTEIVRWIVEDLYEFIDVGVLVLGRNALEWAVEHQLDMRKLTDESIAAHKAHMNRAMDVCQLLITKYGSKIDANRPRGTVLTACTNSSCVDLVAYLVKTYGIKLVYSNGTANDFALLVKHKYDTEAELYLYQHRARMTKRLQNDVLLPVTHYGSAHMFKTVLDMFEFEINLRQIQAVLKTLFEGSVLTDTETMYAKVELALDRWASQLTVPMITNYLVDLWNLKHVSMKRKKEGMGERHGRIIQMITHVCLDKIEGNGVWIALAACCFTRNTELFDSVFSSKLDQVKENPQFMHHVLTECSNLGGTVMLKHILNKYKVFVSQTAVSIWSHSGNAQGLRMLLDSGVCEGKILESSGALVYPCWGGDEEVVKVLVKSAGLSFKGSHYREAFNAACYSGHEGIVSTLIACRDRIDFRPTKGFGLELNHVKSSIISLLNSTFGTTLDSKGHESATLN